MNACDSKDSNKPDDGIRTYVLRPPQASRFKIDYEAELNPQQLDVTMAGEGPLLVIAGAGSGKTRTLTYRVARLIESGANPHRVVLLTFTNKAAREMLHRVEFLVKANIRRIWGGTFHHVANMILRRHAKLLGYDNNFTILDREDERGLIEICAREKGVNRSEKRFPKEDVISEVKSLAINTTKKPAEIIVKQFPHLVDFIGEIDQVLALYQTKKQKMSAMDFDDLLQNLLTLLSQNEKVLHSLSSRFQHVLVDEYQDTSKIQADIVDMLASANRNVMVVGDDCQSIYSFRGANFENIMKFPERYPDSKIFKLETNYRSSPQILNLANSSIVHNKRQYGKVLTAVKSPSSRPQLVPLEDVHQQAAFIGQRILELRDDGISLSEIAVLYRAHYHSMEIQMELTRRGIPYDVRSGLRFFEQAHVKDVTSYLRIIMNPLDELAWKRVVKLYPKIGNRTADKIWQHISSAPSPLEAISRKSTRDLLPKGAHAGWDALLKILEKLQTPALRKAPAEMIDLVLASGYHDYLKLTFPNYESRYEDLRQLSNFALQYGSLENLISELALLTTVRGEEVQRGDPEEETLVLTTIHQAKGLEWKVVFLVWLCEGRFPAVRVLQDEDDLEEERRLFYVAVTRAKDELYLCYPIMARDRANFATIQKPSRFVRELDRRTFEELHVSEQCTWMSEEDEATGW